MQIIFRFFWVRLRNYTEAEFFLVTLLWFRFPLQDGMDLSLGTSVDATLAAIECAEHVIAVVNKNVPRAWGDAMIPTSMIDYFVECDGLLEPAHFTEPDEIEAAIGKLCRIDWTGLAFKWVSVQFRMQCLRIGKPESGNTHRDVCGRRSSSCWKVLLTEQTSDELEANGFILMGSQACYDIDDNLVKL